MPWALVRQIGAGRLPWALVWWASVRRLPWAAVRRIGWQLRWTLVRRVGVGSSALVRWVYVRRLPWGLVRQVGERRLPWAFNALAFGTWPLWRVCLALKILIHTMSRNMAMWCLVCWARIRRCWKVRYSRWVWRRWTSIPKCSTGLLFSFWSEFVLNTGRKTRCTKKANEII